MIKKLIEIAKTKLSKEERKHLAVLIIIAVIVFLSGYAFAEIFLKEDFVVNTTSTVYAYEEFLGKPFDINGVELKGAYAVLENESSNPYVEMNVNGDPQLLTIELHNDMCHIDYNMNEDENKLETSLSIKVKVFFEDGSSKEHTTFKVLENNNILLFDFPEGTKNIILVSPHTMTGHEFFSSSEYEVVKRYELIKDIYINFD